MVATGPVAQPTVVAELLEGGFRGALLCEKPLATSLVSGRDLVDRAAAAGAVLAVNHQRRFGYAVGEAHRLLREGVLGDLLRVEGHIADGTLFDWAPHWIDLAFMLTGDAPVRWVHGMVDLRHRQWHGGMELEGSSLVVWEHEGGVRGQLECGLPVAGQPLVRLLGTEGVIELGAAPQRPGPGPRGPALRILAGGAAGWRSVDVGESVLSGAQWDRSLDELVRAYRDRREPPHGGRRALAALEVCLAGYRGAVSGRRQALPLDPETDIRFLFDGRLRHPGGAR